MLASYILKSQIIRHFQNKVNYKLKRAKKLAEPFRVPPISIVFFSFVFRFQQHCVIVGIPIFFFHSKV